MSPRFAEQLDDFREELSDSLGRIQSDGVRSLTIVQRMQSLGVVGGTPTLTELHSVLTRAVRVGCVTFESGLNIRPPGLIMPVGNVLERSNSLTL